MTMELKFLALVEWIQKISDKYMEADFPNLTKPKITYTDGPSYWRIVRSEPHSQSVYCFVRKSDGAVFKAAGWKAPYTKSGPRCFLDNFEDSNFGAYGVNYLRGGGGYGPNGYPERPECLKPVATAV